MRWTIHLFATPEEAEAILGDLEEERTQITARSGEAVARRWYWRQALRTVAHLAVSPFRETPLRMIGIGVVGLALTFPMSWGARGVAGGIVSNIEVYRYIPANVFWMVTGLMAPVATGFMGAWMLGKRAMSGAIAMFLALGIWVSVVDPVLMLFVLPPRPHMSYTFSFFATRILMLLTVWGATIVMGAALGVTVKRRLASAGAG